MSYTGDAKWMNQKIIPQGIGGKDKDSFGCPNLTQWMPKGNLKSSKKGEFPNQWFDYLIEECEKFWGKSYEDIEFPITK